MKAIYNIYNLSNNERYDTIINRMIITNDNLLQMNELLYSIYKYVSHVVLVPNFNHNNKLYSCGSFYGIEVLEDNIGKAFALYEVTENLKIRGTFIDDKQYQNYYKSINRDIKLNKLLEENK